MVPRVDRTSPFARDPLDDHRQIRESDGELVSDPIWPREIAIGLKQGQLLAGDTLLVREPVCLY